MVRETFSTIAVVTLLTHGALDLQAQVDARSVRQSFARIEDSIVHIRTIADLEYREKDPETGEVRVLTRPYLVNGTGVVVGSVVVDGVEEYLILTNHHVADASNYVLQDGDHLRVNTANTLAVPSVHEESYLVLKGGSGTKGGAREGTIRLVEIVRLVRGDMTLMRTIGADRKLCTFGGRIGYLPRGISAGGRIVTSGYPFGGSRVVGVGRLVTVDERHELGLPHDDLVIDVPVVPGQSGSPIFLVEGEEEPSFRLIGLVHATDQEGTSYGVSYRSWEEALDAFPEVLQERLVR